MRVSQSRSRIERTASEMMWQVQTRRPGLMIFSRSAADGERRIIVWFTTDDKVRAATHEFSAGRSIRLTPGASEVLWHLEFWAKLSPR